MMYEISKEMFKQRIENKLNFVFIDLLPQDKSQQVQIEGTENIPYTNDFPDNFEKKYPEKTQNILLYTFEEGNRNPEKAAEQLREKGYHFVYFYCGHSEDVILDKGLN